MIRFDNVCKHFTKNGTVVRALDGVSFDVPRGSLAIVQGPSGSGKSTLIHLAAGLMRPTRGGVTVAGCPLHERSLRARAELRASQVAVVFQMFHLVPYLSTLDNVLLPTLCPTGAGSLQRALELLEALGIAHRTSHLPAELSAGERQRCAVARALLNRPSLILADEPTGNLDSESAHLVMRMLESSRDEGATVLLVSHHHTGAVQPDLHLNLSNGILQP